MSGRFFKNVFARQRVVDSPPPSLVASPDDPRVREMVLAETANVDSKSEAARPTQSSSLSQSSSSPSQSLSQSSSSLSHSQSQSQSQLSAEPATEQPLDANSESTSDTPRMKDLNLGARLGAGGMGVVYKAHHKGVDKTLAVKMLHPRFADDPKVMKRFEQEARSASLLTHVNLASVYDFGVSDKGEPYLVMDYIDGTTLQDVLKSETSLAVPRFLHIFKQVCDALSHAHMKQLVHRDLKPANIMLVATAGQSDFVKIVDFGIAKALPQANTDEQRLTQTGEVLGSPIYMSPEQCLGDPPDARSDIYSLGCVMYETLVGRPPFLRDNVVQTILAHLNDTPIPFKEAAPQRALPEAIENIVRKCLEKNPLKRFQTIQDLKDALELADEGTSAPEKKLIAARLFKSKLKRVLNNHRRTTALTLSAALVLAAVSTFGVLRANDENILKESMKTADAFDYRQSPQEAQPFWQKAIETAERIGKPENAIANLYRKLAVDCSPQQAALKESSLKKAVRLLEKPGASQVEYTHALSELHTCLAVSKKNFVQPVAALTVLQDKAESASLGGNYALAEKYLEQDLKLDRDAWHPILGLAQCAELRAVSAPIDQQLRLEHRAAFLYPHQPFVGNLDEMIEKTGKKPSSFDDRIALAKTAESENDLEGSIVEYQAALEIKADPAVRTTLKTLYERLKQRNETSGKSYYNTTTDEQISVLEKLFAQQRKLQAQNADVAGAEQRFSNMQPLILPKTRKANVYPTEDGATATMASLAECYSRRSRNAECEFMLKEYLQRQPELITLSLGSWNLPPLQEKTGLPLLASTVHARGKNSEAAVYFKFMVKHCLDIFRNTSDENDKMLIGEYADVLHEMNRPEDEQKARELITTRKEMRAKTDCRVPDLFGSSGGTYKEPNIELESLNP